MYPPGPANALMLGAATRKNAKRRPASLLCVAMRLPIELRYAVVSASSITGMLRRTSRMKAAPIRCSSSRLTTAEELSPISGRRISAAPDGRASASRARPRTRRAARMAGAGMGAGIARMGSVPAS
jgi:hypothetical protein